LAYFAQYDGNGRGVCAFSIEKRFSALLEGFMVKNAGEEFFCLDMGRVIY